MSRSSITRNALRISTVEGCWAVGHFVLTSGAFFTGFALFLGATDFQLGVLAAIPLLAQVFQLPGAYIVEKTGWRRQIVGWFSVVSRSFWLPIALVPLLPGHHAMRWFMALYLVSSVVMNFAGAGWVAWMSAIVPPQIRGRYFGMRNRINGGISIIASLVAGLVIDAFRDRHFEQGGYLTLQLIAVFAGLMAFRLILRQPDPDYRAEELPPLGRYLLQPLRDANYRHIMFFYLYWMFAVSLAAPFFNAHLLKHMNWNFRRLAVVGILFSVSNILFHPLWGKLVDRYGHKPILMTTATGIVALPLFYAFCPWDARWPIYFNAIFGGICWAGNGLALFNLILEFLPANRRTMYVAVLAALSGIVNFVASILSGWLAQLLAGLEWNVMGFTVVNYTVLFLITAVLRIPALLILHHIREPDAVQTRVFVRRMFIEFNRRIGIGRHVFPYP